MSDEQCMQMALQLAKTACSQTSPNPMVGCVLCKEHEIVGLGAHLKAGEAHAEINALQMAQEKAQGATVYVTLEPCSHIGKTGPCVEALIKAQVAKVHIATLDPNPLVAGRGVQQLEEAGIKVTVGLCEAEARALNAPYFYYIQHGLPYVTLKQAISLDGKISIKKGEKTAITGEEVQQDVHAARAMHDAVLVGTNTVCIDNPRLTNRLGATGRQPIRIVIDRHGKIPNHAAVFQDHTAPTWLFTTTPRSIQNIRIWVLPDCSLLTILKIVAQEGIMTLYVEPGKQLATSFITQGLVQKMIVYIAPTFFGEEGLTMITSQQTEAFTFTKVEQIGEDLKLTLTMK